MGSVSAPKSACADVAASRPWRPVLWLSPQPQHLSLQPTPYATLILTLPGWLSGLSGLGEPSEVVYLESASVWAVGHLPGRPRALLNRMVVGISAHLLWVPGDAPDENAGPKTGPDDLRATFE